jgi:hypothetical protein
MNSVRCAPLSCSQARNRKQETGFSRISIQLPIDNAYSILCIEQTHNSTHSSCIYRPLFYKPVASHLIQQQLRSRFAMHHCSCRAVCLLKCAPAMTESKARYIAMYYSTRTLFHSLPLQCVCYYTACCLSGTAWHIRALVDAPAANSECAVSHQELPLSSLYSPRPTLLVYRTLQLNIPHLHTYSTYTSR